MTTNLSQRERLTGAMIELSALRGDPEVGIEDVCSLAGVSPVTFYEQFGSKEEFFRAAHRSCVERAFGGIGATVAEDSEWPDRAQPALAGLLEAVRRDPDAARVRFIEALAGGPMIRAESEQACSALEHATERLLQRIPPGSETVDLPPLAVIGALRYLISHHLRNRAEDLLPTLLEDGPTWSFARAGAREEWSTSSGALIGVPDEQLVRATWTPTRLRPGRHDLTASAVARSQRARLIQATAEVALSEGLENTRVAEIAARARVAKPAFYRFFSDRKNVLLETQQTAICCIFERREEAYFSVEPWPERVWRCLEALIAMIAGNPAMAHASMVACYAAGHAAIREGEGLSHSFARFLQEGYRWRPEARALPPLCALASAGAIFEIVRRCVADDDIAGLAKRRPSSRTSRWRRSGGGGGDWDRGGDEGRESRPRLEAGAR
jgi:AcrR family transcriptional regulator